MEGTSGVQDPEWWDSANAGSPGKENADEGDEGAHFSKAPGAYFSKEQIEASSEPIADTPVTPEKSSDVLSKIRTAQKDAELRRGGAGYSAGGSTHSPPSRCSSSRGSPSTAPPASPEEVKAAADIRAAQKKATAVAKGAATSPQQARVAANIRAAQKQASAASGAGPWHDRAAAEIRVAQLQATAAHANPGDAIRAAQMQAARRRPGGADELSNMILNAQLRGIPAAQADAMAAPKWGVASPAMAAMAHAHYESVAHGYWYSSAGLCLGPEMLLGNWVDVTGNLIRVYSMDAWELRLMASIARPNKPDLHFALRSTHDGGWHCGANTLNTEISTLEQLTWITPNGQSTVWMRGRE